MSNRTNINKKDNPLVSVITPVLNGIKYLEACIQSVLNQRYSYIEHIFVDGGSSDGTLDILKNYKAKYPNRIRLTSEPDRGACDAWNKGLKMAKGEIFGWLGADDRYELDAVQAVVEFFRANPDAYFVFGDCHFINERDEIVGKYPTRDFNLEEVINDLNPIPGSSAFYKREVIERIGFMDTSINSCDLDYWIRVGKVFQIHRVREVLSNFRIHKDSVSCSKGAGIMYARECYLINRRYGGHIFSAYRRYLRAIIIELLRLILGPLYPLIKKKVLRRG